jgi:hypothetical protein
MENPRLVVEARMMVLVGVGGVLGSVKLRPAIVHHRFKLRTQPHPLPRSSAVIVSWSGKVVMGLGFFAPNPMAEA